MTRKANDGRDSPFSDWLRYHPKLDSIKQHVAATDCDMWIHRYRLYKDEIGERWIEHIMLIEVKAFGADMSFSQNDTLRTVHQLLTNNTKVRGPNRTQKVIGGNGKLVLVKSWGVHLLQLSSDRRDTSELILWDREEVSLPELLEILLFDRSPNTRRPYSDRRHHKDRNRLLFGSE